MTGFTKGPWVARKNGEVGIVDDSDTQSRGMMVPVCYIDKYNFQEHDANARLIAAAPCLLSALQSILNHGPDAMPIKEAFEVGRLAVERALGDKV